MSTDVQHLANKYRPQRFSEVLGQDQVVGTLRGMIKRQRVSPTLLLHGPRSTGKTTIARLLPMYLNCAKPGDNGTPCRECPSCVAMLKVIQGSAVHPDVTELNVALHGGIDTIRSLESLAPQAPRFRKRVFILDEAHQITPQAFKGALKLFEDPPRRTMFILCTTNPEKIPEEIMSRCESFRLTPVDAILVAKRLYEVAVKEGFKPGSKENLQFLCKEIANATGGHLREALGLLDMVHSYTHGKRGAIDWKELVPEIVENTPELVPYVAVQKYMQGVLEGKRALPFVAIERTHNYEYFLRRVLETWQLIIGSWIDEKQLFDPSKGWMLKGMSYPPAELGRQLMERTDAIEEILRIYTEALERIKMYATDPKAVTQCATLKVVKLWTQALPKK